MPDRLPAMADHPFRIEPRWVHHLQEQIDALRVLGASNTKAIGATMDSIKALGETAQILIDAMGTGTTKLPGAGYCTPHPIWGYKRDHKFPRYHDEECCFRCGTRKPEEKPNGRS